MRNRWTLLAPSLIFVAVVTQIPFILTLWYSFRHWILTNPTNIHFAGFQNYQYIFEDPTFYKSILNTLIFTGGAVLISMFIGLLLALLMNADIPGKNVLRVLMITPYFVMSSVNAILWKDLMLNPSFGLVDWLLPHLGLHSVDWLSSLPRVSILVELVWQYAPFMMLVSLAGLQSLPTDIAEAARVDGANGLKEFFHITLPHIRKYLEIEFFLGIILILQVFGRIFITTSGGPGGSTTNLAYYTYLQGFSQYNVGGAAAVGIITVILTTIIGTFLFRTLMRFD